MNLLKSTSGRVHPIRMLRNCLIPKVDEFIIKSTGGQVYNKVHKVEKLKLLVLKWTSSLSPQIDEFIIKPLSGRVHY